MATRKTMYLSLIPNQNSRFIITNLTEPYHIPYSTILLLNVYLDTSSMSENTFKVNAGDFKYSKVFFWDFIFLSNCSTMIQISSRVSNTATQGSDDLV